MITGIRREIRRLADPKRARAASRYFKTGKGEYGEGDIFVGLTVPQARLIARNFFGLNFSELERLIKSKIHEERLIALLILVSKFSKGDAREKKFIYKRYLKLARYVNNWDLVDLSAPKIVGSYLYTTGKNINILERLGCSNNIWERRIAVLSTFSFIQHDVFAPALKLAEMLVSDSHDLIQKAVGWMLREVGKKDLKMELRFLEKHCKTMPRTMLRYAIERFPKRLRQRLLRRY